MELILKKSSALTADEKRQITGLAAIFEGLEVNRINYLNTYFEDADYEIVVEKTGEKVVAFSFFKFGKMVVPRLNRQLPHIQFSLTIKSPEASKRIIEKFGVFYFTQKLGKFYWLKEITASSLIVSPKVFQVFAKHFPVNNFNPTKFSTTEIAALLRKQFSRVDVINDEENIVEISGLLATDITHDWERNYKSKEAHINAYFIQNGMIRQEASATYKTNRNLMVFGYRSPWLLKSYTPDKSLKNTAKRME